MFQRTLLVSTAMAVLAALTQVVNAEHSFTFRNLCSSTVNPAIANVNCGYSKRCDTPGSGGVPNPAIPYSGPQPPALGSGHSVTMMVNRQWNGRIFSQNGECGSKGEHCTFTEFSLDTGNKSSPQVYDLSNVQGFTQSIQIAVDGGCDSVTCTNVNCGCSNAYPPGDASGCGHETPVRGCSAGDHSWTITFCP